jgi:hypothetical protein
MCFLRYDNRCFMSGKPCSEAENTCFLWTLAMQRSLALDALGRDSDVVAYFERLKRLPYGSLSLTV